ncbi:MAG: histidine--tRNA ligase [Nanoarchaeota archaeon]|nr:histidine--tRNA ligase [Nanoarchaeota archaeon]
MKLDISTVKGFQDYLPPESLIRDKIKKIAEKHYKLYGFLPVETPIIEFDELMKPDALPNEEEDEAVRDRFKLQDRGGRNLGLRYEFTFQLARIFKENQNIKLPFKRFQIGNNFRDEPIRAGRTRQFTQCDADIVGDSSVNADAECISLSSDILKELQIKNFEIQVNNRKLLNAIIESVEIQEIKQVLKELDKIEKIGSDIVKSNLKKYASSNQIVTLFKLVEKPLEFFKENAFDGAEELDLFIKKCSLYGIETKFSPSLVRGFGYYTGNIFEFILPDKKTTIVAGGRYDKSVGKFINRELPAVGISFSIEALMGLCMNELSSLEIEPIPKVLIISFNQDEESIKLSKKLRNNNIACSITEGQPSKALDFANHQKIPFVLFLGEEELEKQKFKIKEMSTGLESFLAEKQLLAKLKK